MRSEGGGDKGERGMGGKLEGGERGDGGSSRVHPRSPG